MFSNVLLPQPEWPIKQTNSLFSIASETLSSARSPLPERSTNDIDTSLISRSAIVLFPETEAFAYSLEQNV